MQINEPSPAYSHKPLTADEYLELEKAAADKHEYYRGDVFAMAGAKLPHNIICRNLLVSLGQKLKGGGCQPFGSDLRIHIPANTLFTYPDLSVFCEEVQTLHNDEMNALNPIVLIEVLSKYSKHYDRGDKFKLYRDIATLRQYVLIDSLSVSIESFAVNRTGHWELQEYKSVNEALFLEAIRTGISLNEIYEGTKLLSVLS